ncbi:MAG: alpha/beta hydrolase family protein [Cyclobacteriaceae bacterium]
MNKLEILSISIITGCLFLLPKITLPKVRQPLNVMLILLIGLNVSLNGLRWPMMPAFLVLSYVVYKSIFYESRQRHALIKTTKWASLIVMIVLAWGLPIIFPLFKFPEPTGSYQVGTKWIYLIDSTRDEVITANPKDKRELMVKIWYPTDSQVGIQDSYLLKSERVGFARKYGLPDWTISYFSKIKTNVLADAGIAKGIFPVLIFSHGYESPATNYYAFLTEVVSHGYIVVNINHTYESTSSEFPDGQIKFNNDSFSVATNLNPKMIELAWRSTEKFQKAQDAEHKLQIVTELVHHYSGSEIVRRWAKDISFVIDQLEQENKVPKSFLYNKMNLSQIGAFGHSMGGAAAGQALLFDNRLSAAANWDGSQWGDVIDTIFQKPFILLSHSVSLKIGFEINSQVYHRKSKSLFYDVIINGTGHSNYCDIPYWIKLNLINEAGGIDMDRGVSIITKVTLDFFDSHLLNKPVSFTKRLTEFKELDIKIYKDGTEKKTID